MPSPPSSQGVTVSWGGFFIGNLTSFKATAGTAVFEEVTNVTSAVIGSGGDARVVKQYDCTAIDPGGVDIGLFGTPSAVLTQVGEQKTVSVTWADGSLSCDAFLETFDVTGNVGEFLAGTARFRFSGLDWS